MPRVPKIALLPDDVRSELERRLVKNGFGGYVELAEWLTEQGYEISKSAVHEFGRDFRDRLGALKIATEQARAIVAESPDDEGAMSEALMRLTQEKLFQVLLELEVDPEKLSLTGLSRAIAELGRASVNQKKWAAEVKAKAAAAAEDVGRIARDGGLSEDSVKLIRQTVLGIV